MRSFSEVIREEVDNKKPYRLVVIAERRMVKKAKKNSDKPVVKKPSSTSSKLYNLAKEAGCKVYSVKVNGAYLERDDKGIITIHNQDDKTNRPRKRNMFESCKSCQWSMGWC